MWVRRLAWNFALAAPAFLLAWAPARLSLPSGSLSDVIWPNAGFVLASLLLWGPRAIAPLMLGEFLVALVVGIPLAPSIWVACWEVPVWGWTSVWLLRRFHCYCAGFDSLASVLGLIGLPLGILLYLRVTLGTFFRVWFGWSTWSQYGTDLPAIWLSDAAGVLIIAPVFLAAEREFRFGNRLQVWRCAEAIALASGLLFTSFVLVPRAPVGATLPVLPFLVFPFFIWAALRFGVLGVGVSSLILGFVSFERFFFSGSFRDPHDLQSAMLFYQSLLVVSTITGLLVAGALADRRRAEEHLESAVSERTAELRSANAGKDKLLAIIGHDLRTPLFGLVKLSEYLTESASLITPEKLAAYAGEMHQSAKGQLETLENLLSWARLRTGQTVYQPEEQLVAALVEPVVSLFRLRARLRDIRLEASLPPDQLVVADLEMTRSILRNLLANALRASRAGGLICLAASHEGEHVVLSVRDDGAGMTADQVRTQMTRREVTEPGGLGLLLVREFCEAQGSSLHIESEPGQGTLISFRLRAV